MNPIKKMTPAQKITAAEQLYALAKQLKKCGLKMLHPDWTEEQLDRKVKEIFLYARS